MTKMEDLIEKRTAQERLIIAKTLIESVLDDLQPEPTLEQIKEYCRKRCLSIVDNALLEKYASAQPEKTQLSGEDATKDATFDCISRKVAIDAIEQYRDRFDAIDTNFLDGLKTAINIVKELPSERIGIKFEEVKDNPAYSRYLFESIPSAHPETAKRTAESVQNVSNEDLISRKAVIEVLDRTQRLIPDAKNVLKDHVRILPSAQPKQRWIPCSERLPEYGDDVLVYFKAGRYCPHNRIQVGHLGTHEVEDQFFEAIGSAMVWYTDNFYYRLDNVVAWAPIPEPWEGES